MRRVGSSIVALNDRLTIGPTPGIVISRLLTSSRRATDAERPKGGLTQGPQLENAPVAAIHLESRAQPAGVRVEQLRRRWQAELRSRILQMTKGTWTSNTLY